MVLFAICAIAASLVVPPWAVLRHFDRMDNDPEYRRRARERGF